MLTPAGRIAHILLIDRDAGDALVRWQDGKTARFRLTQLRLAGSGAAT